MSFYEVVKSYRNFDFDKYFNSITENDIKKSLTMATVEKATEQDLLNFLSPTADFFLEEMAQISQKLTNRYFGKAIVLYQPIYVANYCVNSCVYCGFSALNRIKRKQLTLEEVEKEALEISKTEVQQILLLTGESEQYSDFNYICECVKILKNYFNSISIEIYPLSTERYCILKNLGVDGLTIYQETYDEEVYDNLHIAGPKKNYLYRLDTPQRAAEAGIRAIGIGALFGLANSVKDAFFSALHGKYLLDKFKDIEVALSVPRIKESPDTFKIEKAVDDLSLLKFLLAYRLFLPMAGLNLSTRENRFMRDNLIGLGITKMSGGSKTDVGGYSMEDISDKQFEISDGRTVIEIAKAIEEHGHQPIYKDWWQLL